MMCPLCGQLAPANEIAAYRCSCENCWIDMLLRAGSIRPTYRRISPGGHAQQVNWPGCREWAKVFEEVRT